MASAIRAEKGLIESRGRTSPWTERAESQERGQCKNVGFSEVTIEGCLGKIYRIELAEESPGPYTAVTNLGLPFSPIRGSPSLPTLGQQRYYRTSPVPYGQLWTGVKHLTTLDSG